MARELPSYRDNLADILEYSKGARLLSIKMVAKYTGLSDYRAIKRRFPFNDCFISAMTLARCLSEGKTE